MSIAFALHIPDQVLSLPCGASKNKVFIDYSGMVPPATSAFYEQTVWQDSKMLIFTDYCLLNMIWNGIWSSYSIVIEFNEIKSKNTCIHTKIPKNHVCINFQVQPSYTQKSTHMPEVLIGKCYNNNFAVILLCFILRRNLVCSVQVVLATNSLFGLSMFYL